MIPAPWEAEAGGKWEFDGILLQRMLGKPEEAQYDFKRKKDTGLQAQGGDSDMFRATQPE